MRRWVLALMVGPIVGVLVLSAPAGAGEAPREGFGFEFLDADSGFQQVPEFRFGVLIHAVVASDRDPVPDELPITIIGYAGGRRQFEVTIPNDPSRHCRGSDGCSDDLGRVDDPGDGAIVIEARNKNGDLLVRHVQGDPEAAMGTAGEEAEGEEATGEDATGEDAGAPENGDGSSGAGAIVGVAVGAVAAAGAVAAIRRWRRASGSQVYTTTTDAERGKLEEERDRLKEEIDALDRELDELKEVPPEVPETDWFSEQDKVKTELGVGSAWDEVMRRRRELEVELDHVERRIDDVNQRQDAEGRQPPDRPEEPGGGLPDAPEPSGPTYEG